ncbi:hypothetical protein KKC88_01155 [Patescibacteria group bacterium]|nr:hypothetical protein [Patescibacteria group bacterium]MBU1673151.1 hypothetical protein [Patescibacteria group bacterium]MBU1963476.1 hypothetical protein [Patescibacteria group bacterium]
MNGIDIVLILIAIVVLFLILKTVKKLIFVGMLLVLVFGVVGVLMYFVSQSDSALAQTTTQWVMASRFGAPLFNSVTFIANIFS